MHVQVRAGVSRQLTSLPTPSTGIGSATGMTHNLGSLSAVSEFLKDYGDSLSLADRRTLLRDAQREHFGVMNERWAWPWENSASHVRAMEREIHIAAGKEAGKRAFDLGRASHYGNAEAMMAKGAEYEARSFAGEALGAVKKAKNFLYDAPIAKAKGRLGTGLLVAGGVGLGAYLLSKWGKGASNPTREGADIANDVGMRDAAADIGVQQPGSFIPSAGSDGASLTPAYPVPQAPMMPAPGMDAAAAPGFPSPMVSSPQIQGNRGMILNPEAIAGEMAQRYGSPAAAEPSR